MKKLFFLLTLPLFLMANPSPFGLKIGTATIQDVKSKYHVFNERINQYSKGKMYNIDISDIQFDGLKRLVVIFSKDGKLQAVLSTLDKNRFNFLYNSLRKKYKLVYKKIPFVGNKSAKFISDNTEITLESPHLSFQMQMDYIDKNLWKSYKQQSKKEQEQKRKKENSQL